MFQFSQNNQNYTSKQMSFSFKNMNVMIGCLERERERETLLMNLLEINVSHLTVSCGTVHTGTQTGVYCSDGM